MLFRSFRGCKNLVVAYLIATAIYQIYFTHRFDFTLYIDNVIHFKVSMHLYFVLLYIQLNFINRFFFGYLQKCPSNVKGYLCEIIMFVIVAIFTINTTNYTNILDVYGGGGKLLGGTFLLLYYLEMVIEKHGVLTDISVKKSAFILLFSSMIWFIFWRYICEYGWILDQYFPYMGGFNPPSVTLFIFSLCMLGITFGFFTLVERFNYTKWIVKIIGWIGKRSMAIFLYHMLMLEFIRPQYRVYWNNEQTWSARILYFLVMISGSILIDAVVKFLHNVVKRIVTL